MYDGALGRAGDPMGWHGIQNLPPGFDATAGKGAGTTIIDQVIKGDIKGLSPAQRDQFKDLRRHLLHQDYARYFEMSLGCASLLVDLEGGRFVAAVMKDIIDPALQVALDQLESIRKEVAKYIASKRKLEYDAVSSLGQIYSKAKPIADAYPNAPGASRLESTYQAILEEIRPIVSGDAPPH
jgi:hypothetical protein